MLPSLHHGGLVICEPCDVPVSKRHLDMVYAHMRWSDKAHLGAITEMSRAEDSVAMARILHGEDTMAESCVIMANVNTNSPLLVDKVVTESIRVYSSANQGIIVVPFILGGAMGPVTTAASIAQALAEAMMCCAFTQLVRPGAPFILGNFLSSMSLKSGAPTFGMPEPVMSNFIIAQLARRLGVPLRCGGALTASKVADAQAAYESADSMLSTVLGGAFMRVPSTSAPAARQIPYFPFADEEALIRLEDQADWLIQEIGLEFRDDEEALRIWRFTYAGALGRSPRSLRRAGPSLRRRRPAAAFSFMGLPPLPRP